MRIIPVDLAAKLQPQPCLFSIIMILQPSRSYASLFSVYIRPRIKNMVKITLPILSPPHSSNFANIKTYFGDISRIHNLTCKQIYTHATFPDGYNHEHFHCRCSRKCISGLYLATQIREVSTLSLYEFPYCKCFFNAKMYYIYVKAANTYYWTEDLLAFGQKTGTRLKLSDLRRYYIFLCIPF